MVGDMDLRDGTSLGCIGRCKVCGKAIQLRRVYSGHPTNQHEEDRWLHFGYADHRAELSPEVGAYYDQLIAEQIASREMP